jgi:biopolymer transport protein ExbB/TolQ
MSKLDNCILGSIEEIKSDIKSIYSRLQVITEDLYNYKNQRYKCLTDCDDRYLKQSDVENVFKRELEKVIESRTKSAHKKTEIIKNILHIIGAVAPYVAIAGAYLALR